MTSGKYALASGFFAGLLFVCVWGLMREWAGRPVSWDEFGMVVLYFGLGLGLVGGGFLSADLGATLYRAHKTWENDQNAPPPADDDGPDYPTAELVDEAERAWALALERFFRAGDSAGGFSINAMSGVVGSDVWGRLTDFYCSEAGHRILRIAPGNVGTVWGHGWGLDRVLQLVALRQLPHPNGDAPDVQLPIRDTTRRNAPRKSKTQPPEGVPASKMVVDG